MTLPNIFGPDSDKPKHTRQEAEAIIERMSSKDVDAMSPEEADSIVQALGTDFIVSTLLENINKQTILLSDPRGLGPEKTVEFLEGLAERIKGHLIPGNTCPDCGTEGGH